MKMLFLLGLILTASIYVGTVWSGILGGMLIAFVLLRGFMTGMNA